MGFLDSLSKKQRKVLGATGIAAIAASWILVIFAPAFGYSSIDVGFKLTVFYCFVWVLIKVYRRYG
ncbi:hypothetical protein ACK3SF_03415 [Candidatus Nanosalina sp. VS9-1]|uniref:hypothetical protein n=1 Tax=Candidatus Nanosalina sp. VS9-1 TaxID=3388566 RepID=UPI0039E1B4FE